VKEKQSRVDKEKIRKNLSLILDRVHSGTDLALLGEYRKIYKKEISLFRRSWVAAWLLMHHDPKLLPAVDSDRRSRPTENARKTKNEKPDEEKSGAVDFPLSEEESKRLFISIGRNRRLYPREILTLIISKTSVPREDIGVIRILDNYSFVQVRDTRADEIIEALNGLQFRGRTLTVNYAKSKTDESET
jgi:hypothetical protein